MVAVVYRIIDAEFHTFGSQSEDRIHEDDSQIQLNLSEEQEVGGKSDSF